MSGRTGEVKLGLLRTDQSGFHLEENELKSLKGVSP